MWMVIIVIVYDLCYPEEANVVCGYHLYPSYDCPEFFK